MQPGPPLDCPPEIEFVARSFCSQRRMRTTLTIHGSLSGSLSDQAGLTRFVEVCGDLHHDPGRPSWMAGSCDRHDCKQSTSLAETASGRIRDRHDGQDSGPALSLCTVHTASCSSSLDVCRLLRWPCWRPWEERKTSRATRLRSGKQPANFLWHRPIDDTNGVRGGVRVCVNEQRDTPTGVDAACCGSVTVPPSQPNSTSQGMTPRTVTEDPARRELLTCKSMNRQSAACPS